MKRTMPAFFLFSLLVFVFASVASPAYAAANSAVNAPVVDWSSIASGQLPTYNKNRTPDRPDNSLQGRLIVIDPGHGGSDTGAIGPSKVMEKDVALLIAQELRKMLNDVGVTVLMTRTSDRSVAYVGAADKEELAARIGLANQANADMFISIHANAFYDLAGGTSTYFYGATERDALLARSVQNNLVAQLQLYDRGIEQNDFFVLKYAQVPAVLVETAFISNPLEESLLANRGFDRKAALGIYNGIRQYFAAAR
ncbi:N-acetylmuramoyl-L-alanine amidase [Sporomusa aerivorans]|uniref:N-acetylmuramoyl-L-alanine amidase family protein n=1 Tax=Sporomusa aerivorans TaxID=204936 RepID=UPI00352A632B